MEQRGAVLTVWLGGEIDHHAAGQLRAGIDARILAAMPQRVLLDFGGVTFMDSSGIGLILGRQRLLGGTGGTLAVQGVSRPVARMLRLAGIDSVIPMEGSAAK